MTEIMREVDKSTLIEMFNDEKLVAFQLSKSVENEKMIREWESNKNNTIELSVLDESGKTEIFTAATFVSSENIGGNIKIIFRCSPKQQHD